MNSEMIFVFALIGVVAIFIPIVLRIAAEAGDSATSIARRSIFDCRSATYMDCDLS